MPEASAIRFGMAAVKNVGEGPVQVIIDARQEGGPFTSLEDFCDRVDLRQVNKRALECLIKVGALDRFGRRSQLLDVLDNIVGQSAAIHSARESGQLSMFELMGDSDAGHAAPIHLPNLEPESGRDRLQWEKELLGVYAMSHPLQHISVDLRNVVTCQCNELDARYDGKSVTMVGMINDVRQIMTKKGQRMAFVQMEDMQGQCEVVVFPRTFEEYGARLVVDSIVVVKGKAQTREGQTSLLADLIQNYVEFASAAESEREQFQTPLIDVPPIINGARAVEETNGNGNGYYVNDDDADEDALPAVEESPFHNDPPRWADEENAAEAGLAAMKQEAAPEAMASKAESDGDAGQRLSPSAPESEGSVSADSVGEHSAGDASHVEDAHVEDVRAEDAQEEHAPEEDAPETVAAEKATKRTDRELKETAETGAAPADGGSAHVRGNGPRTVLITFRATGNLDRDKYRLKEIYECVRDPRGPRPVPVALAVGPSHRASRLSARPLHDQRTHVDRTGQALPRRGGGGVESSDHTSCQHDWTAEDVCYQVVS